MGGVSAVQEPELLNANHVVSSFDSGKPELDFFLSHLALASQREGFARTFVVSDASLSVVGYYALCGGAIGRAELPRRIGGHGTPPEVPVVLLARLAVDRTMQGRGLGTMLMHHAFRSAMAAGATVAFRAMMVHALDDEAADFYSKFGFRSTRSAQNTLLIGQKDIAHILDSVPSSDG